MEMRIFTVLMLSVLLSLNSGAQAVVIDCVTVGNAGNAPDAVFGGVNYEYQIGKYEVTAGQYCEFLNAVAASDDYELYDTQMWSSSYGCKIERTESPGSYMYSIADDWSNRPVNYVSWGDAARFVNWLHNGQPTGLQGLSTTEDGAYFLNGATSNEDLVAVVRKPNAMWAIPTEDEWYKAAYHKNDGVTGNYWDYPVRSDGPPSNILDGGGNNVTFYDNGWTIGSPYWRTVVGEHLNSESAYGTFDQGGNAWETLESTMADDDSTYHVLRGGAFFNYTTRLSAAERYPDNPAIYHPTYGLGSHGFRVVRIIQRCDYVLTGDLNDDCEVDFDDFALMAANWLIDCNSNPADPACVSK